jgi:hypothetical protein
MIGFMISLSEFIKSTKRKKLPLDLQCPVYNKGLPFLQCLAENSACTCSEMENIGSEKRKKKFNLQSERQQKGNDAE